MTPEEAAFVRDLRAKILSNQRKGLPPSSGIDKEDLRKAIDYSRKAYTAAQSKSKASGVSNPSGGSAGPTIDLDSLFTNKKSG